MPEKTNHKELQEGQSQDAGKKQRQIYLTLPPMKRETFEKTVAELKENGAKFDSYSRAWYITPEMDFNKFKNYLGAPYEYVNEKARILRAQEAERKAEADVGQKGMPVKEEKESVADKLGRNKEVVDKNTPVKTEPEHSRDEAR